MGWRAPARPEERAWPFWLGAAMVSVGVALHLPMWWAARAMHYRMAGMAMGPDMYAGMGLILAGLVVCGAGLGTAAPTIDRPAAGAAPRGEFNPAHAALMAALVLALVIDVMKAASLGFVLPGMRSEYGLTRSAAALLPLTALSGTVAGSFAWGVIGDLYGRKPSILLAGVMFVATSICGAMPSYRWNLAMCFLMGAAVGGMLPAAYALLTETMPTRHRGWSLVLVGGLGGAGGYLAAASLSAVLQPQFGWRVMWLLGLPTGVGLLLLSAALPESPRFLAARGRLVAARAVLGRYGVHDAEDFAAPDRASPPGRLAGASLGFTACALAWGLTNFGLLLWLPMRLAEHGDVASASALLSRAALIALPTTLGAALLYSRWSAKGCVLLMIALVLAGLVAATGAGRVSGAAGLAMLALLLVGINGLFAVLLPFAAETFPQAVRGSATGWVAGMTKAGGVLAQLLALLAVATDWGAVAGVTAALFGVALVLLAGFALETRGVALPGLHGPARA